MYYNSCSCIKAFSAIPRRINPFEFCSRCHKSFTTRQISSRSPSYAHEWPRFDGHIAYIFGSSISWNKILSVCSVPHRMDRLIQIACARSVRITFSSKIFMGKLRRLTGWRHTCESALCAKPYLELHVPNAKLSARRLERTRSFKLFSRVRSEKLLI